MVTQVKLPDGNIAQFPDDMSMEAITAVLQKQFPPQQVEQESTIGNTLKSVGKSLVRGTADLPLGIAQAVTEAFPENETAQMLRQSIGRVTQESENIAEQGGIAGQVARVVPQALQLAASPLKAGAGLANMATRAAQVGATSGAATYLQPTTETETTPIEAVENRAKPAAMAAATGLVLSPAFEVALKGASKAIPYFNKLIGGTSEVVQETPLTKAESFIQEALPEKDVANISTRVADSASLSVSEPLFSAAETPVIRQYANVLARSGNTTLQAREAVDKFIASSSVKEASLLKKLAPQVATPDDAAVLFKTGIETIKDKASAVRAEAARPLYEAAKSDIIPDEAVQSLLKSERIASAFKSAASQLPDEFKSLPENSAAKLDLVSRFLKGSARAETNDTIRKSINDAVNQIDGVLLNTSDNLKQARALYSKGSSDINDLLGYNKKTLVARVLDAPDPVIATQRLFKGSPAEIASTREIFKRYNMSDAFNSGVKAHMLKKLNDMKANPNLSKAFANETERQQLRAALGDDNLSKAFFKMLELNSRQLKSLNALGGSPTAPLQQAVAEIDLAGQTGLAKGATEAFKAYGALLSPRETAADLAARWQNPQFKTELANILFDAKEGKQFVDKLLKVKTEKEANVIINQLNNLAAQRASQKAAIGTAIGTQQGE